MKRLFILFFLAACLWAGRIVPELEAILKNASPSDMIGIIVRTKEQADLSLLPPDATYDEKIEYLKFVAERAQKGILEYLKTVKAEDIRCFSLVSDIALKTTPEVIRELANREDVDFVMDDFIVKLDDVWLGETTEQDATETPEWNITKVRADTCWMDGYTGQGVVVANMDTGVEVTHPAFGGRWRSTNGWYDAVNGQSSPYDDNGHGTHTMGTMTGGDGLGPFANDIGVAPGATFICAKAFDANGSGQASWISACFNWFANTGRPNVISNSWGSGRTTTTWWSYIVNLRNLGIIVVASIGNSGPSSGTSNAPGSYPIVIGVGATNSNDDIESYSSRGPAPNQDPWNNPANWPRSDWNLINPAISAPGTVRSALPGGSYGTMSGTSMASPHVGGAVALMLEKMPSLTPDQAFNYITNNADRPSQGGTYPNNNYGWGRLNCKKILDAMVPANKPNIILARTAITGENGNGRLDPGETGNLITYLKNTTAIQATNLRGTLRENDPYLTISDSLANFGNVPGNDSTNNLSDPFVLSASSSTPRGYTANLTLYLVCNETSWTRTFTLTIGQPVQQPGTRLWGPTQVSGVPSTAGLYGIAYNPTNNRIYVCHFRARNIYMFSSDSLLTPLGTIPTPNNESACTDIKYCAYDNTFWVASNQTKRVYKISATGSVLRYFSNPANDYPTGLAWDENNRILYLADRRSALGALPGYIYVTDTLGNQIRRMNVPLSANYGPRCLALERTPSNPNLPTLIHVYTSFNSQGTALDSVGVYEMNRDNLTILQRFLIPELYNARGVEYDPRNATLWVTIMELAAGGPNNYIAKYAGFHEMVGMEEEKTPLKNLTQISCYPNPFNQSLNIAYELKKRSEVSLSIHDATGRQIAQLQEGISNPGNYHFVWQANNAGVYFVRIKTKEGSLWQKVIKF
ncbi:MAG: S8 family serine peptidase [candidate division WOR-3 bacterium]